MKKINKIGVFVLLLVGVFVFKQDVYADCELGVTCHYINLQIGEESYKANMKLYTPTEGEKYLESGTAKLYDLPMPYKEGYKFDGWYYDEEMTTKINVATIGDLNLTTTGYNTYYGRWLEDEEKSNTDGNIIVSSPQEEKENVTSSQEPTDTTTIGATDNITDTKDTKDNTMIYVGYIVGGIVLVIVGTVIIIKINNKRGFE